MRVYLSFLRPILDYTCLAWHPDVSNWLFDRMEAVLRKRSRIIFNEVKVLYISFCRKANQVILNERRTKFSLHFANNVFHNLPKNSLFPSQFFFLRPCLPRSVSTKSSFCPQWNFPLKDIEELYTEYKK